ncbi:hypothetical protein [Streptomyces cylindrosporus]|uniref:Uncharacterized protein n=1 Tax=Streptomyces cylindrosporus TaxID=2927583 RepID=A0ABS9YJU7_9ACTN|nr:hypothetical protein [Streptomyces cylindrosporus]MCI3277521.1 hypothetical protein [Streptomyces cylindrosporus]
MARAIPLATGTADAQAVTGACTLVGFSARETGGTNSADVTFRDGTDASGAIKAIARLVANGSQAGPLPPVDFATGIFIDRSGTGSSELVLYLL